MSYVRMFLVLMLVCFSAGAEAQQAMDDEISAIVASYNDIKSGSYEKDDKLKRLETLHAQAVKLAKAYPKRAEPLIWQGWIICETGRLKGILGMSSFKTARKSLEEGLALDETVYSGKPLITLGKLYNVLPPWPVSYGNMEKARFYLEKGLAQDTVDAEANYSYARWLFDDEKYELAKQHLKVATTTNQSGPPEGRNQELQDRIVKLSEKVDSEIR